MIGIGLTTVAMSAQTPATPSSAAPRTAGPAQAVNPANAALLANIQISKLPNGNWKCTSVGGRVCSGPEVQALTTVTKSRSNVKDNLIVGTDGTLKCTSAADGKPCTDAVMNDFMAQAKAITKGGQQGF